MQTDQYITANAKDAQTLQEQLAKLLEQITDAARRAVAPFVENWEQDKQELAPPEPRNIQSDLRIQSGRRVIYGETARGVRNELTPELLQALAQAIQQPKDEGASLEDYHNRVPRFEIKLGTEIVFRQERDGAVTDNQLRLERQTEQQQAVVEEVEELLEQTQVALSPQEWQEAYTIKNTASTLIERFGVPYEAGQGVRIGDWEVTQSEDKSFSVRENSDLVLQTDSTGKIVQADSERFEQAVYQLGGAVLASNLEPQVQQQNEQISTVEASVDPVSADLDLNGLSDAPEIVDSPNSLGFDIANDDVGDRVDSLNGTNPQLDENSDDLYQGFNQLLDDVYGAKPSKSNQEIASNPSAETTLKENSSKPPTVEVKEIPEAIRLANSEVKKAPEGNTKQLFNALVNELGKEAQKFGKQALDWAATRPQWIRDQGIAATALKLFNNNYSKTGETTYQAENYEVKLQGLNNYQINDRDGKLLMEFQKTALGGIKVKGENHMVTPDYQQFNNARQSLQQSKQDILSQDSFHRVSLLSGLAPRGDLEVINTLKTKEVMNTARSFLENMGIERWDAGEKGNYNIEGQANGYLRIDSKADGRGTVLLLVNGQMLTNNLNSKDFTHFCKLEQVMQKGIQTKQEKAATKALTQLPKQQAQKQPIPKKQVGLKL